ncbi:MAG: Uma2 family endonuclease [Hyphomicrobium aestuarii]|nr:Uma2 family endonuclease [Hyphomicrobium aestuarii]
MTAKRNFADAPMTVDEFFAWDGGGHVGKLELVNGRVRAMAPASEAHSSIQLNIGTAIKNHLRATGSKCRAGTEAPVIPPMLPKKNARAPDLAVTCAPPSVDKVFENPILIVEVLSPSNEDDSWETISALASLTSMKEILVVQSTSVEAKVFTRDATGAWPSDPVTALAGGTVHLSSLGLDIPVADIYEGTLLEAEARTIA